MDSREGPHRTVLLPEALGYLRPEPGSVIVDATVGAGGHAEALLEATGPGGRLYGIDLDPEAVEVASRRLARFGERFVAIHGNYADIANLLAARGVFTIDAVVADLGVSSMQLEDAGRGFSFRLDGPLDMRMDPAAGTSAGDLLGSLSETELKRLLRLYGEERRAGAIARAVAREHARTPIRRTRQLSEIAEKVAGARARHHRIHPATRTFQALRIAVNHELESLERFVPAAASLLRRRGRLVITSFHSLEDRIVKHGFRSLAERCICPPGLPRCGCGRENLIRVLTARPVTPGPEETASNPRSRSARLRAAERL